ncbi:hypothetical protein [Sphingobium sp. CR28]|uniref:hypothetical protein n=1 Tax=Sphingobium sp. CR28 TaxID=3400272 RepID=UPI003FEE827F
MLASADRNVLVSLADILADSASIHEAAAKVADDEGLSSRLSVRAQELHALVSEVRRGSDEGEAGSFLKIMDHLRLRVDQWVGDDDEAAMSASRESKAKLLAFIDDMGRRSDLSSTTRTILAEARQHISRSGVAPATAPGLTDLPT